MKTHHIFMCLCIYCKTKTKKKDLRLSLTHPFYCSVEKQNQEIKEVEAAATPKRSNTGPD